eukprot:3736281-Pyramimonas_sp.AAC.2
MPAVRVIIDCTRMPICMPAVRALVAPGCPLGPLGLQRAPSGKIYAVGLPAGGLSGCPRGFSDRPGSLSGCLGGHLGPSRAIRRPQRAPSGKIYTVDCLAGGLSGRPRGFLDRPGSLLGCLGGHLGPPWAIRRPQIAPSVKIYTVGADPPARGSTL